MRNNRYLRIGLILIITVAVITGCGASDSVQTPTPITSNEVIMQGHAFIPTEITIKKGDTITWTNKDAAKHDITGEAFKSDLLAKDQSFEQVFNDVGTFEYSCTPHPYMKGMVIVTE